MEGLFFLKYAECIADILLDESDNVDVIGLRFDAIRTLFSRAQQYAKKGFLPELVETFFTKKSQMILKAETKTEITEILKPSTPYYSGGKMVPESTPYYVEEEELMLWSETSQRGPLISAGYDRYMELFKKLLPEKAKFLDKEAS